jgi:hypothetical protein
MRRLGIPSLVAGLVTLALSGLACKQGLGDRCEQNSDCGSGLVCDRNGQATTAEGGRCVSSSAPPPDSGTEEDTAVSIDADLSDGGADQAQGNDGASGDAPASDGAPGQDAMDDGAPVDSGTDAATD